MRRQHAAPVRDGPVSDPIEEDLGTRIRSLLSTLTPKRRRLAALVLDEPEFVALASAQQLGERAGTDPATIVRFSRQIGFSGYTELRDAVRRSFMPQLTPLEKARRRLNVTHADISVVTQSFERDLDNLSRLPGANRADQLEDLAHRILEARSVVLVSGGLSQAVTATFAHLLQLVGVNALNTTDEVAGAVAIARADETDIVIGVSFWRYISSTTRLLRHAHERGVWTAAITDSQAAPTAEVTDLVLTADVGAPEISLSVVAPIALVNSVAALCATLAPERGYQALVAVDDIYLRADIARRGAGPATKEEKP